MKTIYSVNSADVERCSSAELRECFVCPAFNKAGQTQVYYFHFVDRMAVGEVIPTSDSCLSEGGGTVAPAIFGNDGK
ncbi:MAG: hypothetical protein OWU84_14415 [Firmicutes bacterium]|nr:hypothetical protein [Bacillota bacterium]